MGEDSWGLGKLVFIRVLAALLSRELHVCNIIEYYSKLLSLIIFFCILNIFYLFLPSSIYYLSNRASVSNLIR